MAAMPDYYTLFSTFLLVTVLKATLFYIMPPNLLEAFLEIDFIFDLCSLVLWAALTPILSLTKFLSEEPFNWFVSVLAISELFIYFPEVIFCWFLVASLSLRLVLLPHLLVRLPFVILICRLALEYTCPILPDPLLPCEPVLIELTV